MDPLMDANVAKTPGAPDDAADDMSQGYQICVNVAADGSLTVGVESKQEEDGEEAGSQAPDADPEQPNDGAQPVGSIKEAIQMVMDIYKNNGEMADMAAGDDQFNQGFGAKKPAAPPMGGM